LSKHILCSPGLCRRSCVLSRTDAADACAFRACVRSRSYEVPKRQVSISDLGSSNCGGEKVPCDKTSLISPTCLASGLSLNKASSSMDLQSSLSPEADPRVKARPTDAPSSNLSDPKREDDVNDPLSRDDTFNSNHLSHHSEKAEVAQHGNDRADSPVQPSKSADEKYPDGLVEFDGPDDPDNPKNWSPARKWAITASMGWMTFVVTFASSIFSVATDAVSQEFDIDRLVSTLGVSLFLLVRPFSPAIESL
jgi:hypothetical protein